MTSTLLHERFQALKTPPVKTTEVDEFYLARWEVYVDELSERLLDSSSDTVMVLGHCPGVENLVEALTDRHVSMPTATIAKLTYQHQSWNSLKTNHQEHFELDDLWRPKEVLR